MIVDGNGKTVRRLSYRNATRPLHTVPDGSCFYWDGCNQGGQSVPDGTYRVLAEGWIGDTKFVARSENIVITSMEEESGQ